MPDPQLTDVAGSADRAPVPVDPAAGPWAGELLVALALVLVAFAPTVASLPVLWWQRGGYEQGFLLLPVVGFVLWRDRTELLPPAAHSPTPLAVALAGLSGLWLVFQIMSAQAGSQLMLLMLLTTWGLFTLGWKSWPVVLPAGATLLLAIPVLDAFIPVLREMAVVMSGLFVSLLGIPAEIDGDIITIEWGSFIIENGCAGYGYLVVGLSLGAVYSHLFMRGWRTRLGVVALAGAVTIFSNWIRITHLVWLGYATQMESPTITDHVVHGWVVFSIALIPFFALARWMERWNEPRSGGEDSPPPAAKRAAPEPEAWRRRLTLATGAAVLGPLLFWVGALLPSAEPGDEPIAPLGEGWLRVSAQETATPSPDSLLPWKIGYAGVDRKESSRWVREGAPASVYGQRLIYTRQRQGAELINSLNRIAPDSMVVRTRRVGPLDASGASVRETWVRSGERSWLVWHRYRVAGVTTSSGTRAKLLELWAFLTRRRQAELVALTAPCDPESCTPAARSLFHFVTGRELPADEGSALQGGGGTPPRGADAAPGASGSPDA